jgi:transposase
MRFVGVRSLKNQAALMRHKTREMLVSQRTQLLNGLRGHLAEVGVIAALPRRAQRRCDIGLGTKRSARRVRRLLLDHFLGRVLVPARELSQIAEAQERLAILAAGNSAQLPMDR